MQLTTHITKLLPQWEIILRQIGVSGLNDPPPDIFKNSPPVLIVAEYQKPLKTDLIAYLNNGGAVLMEADVAKKILGIKTRRIFLNYISAQDDPIFGTIPICDFGISTQVLRSASHLQNQSGKWGCRGGKSRQRLCVNFASRVYKRSFIGTG